MKKINVFAVFLVFFVMGFGDVVGTLVSFAEKEFSLSSTMSGLLPFCGFVAFGLLSVPAGILQARKGKKFVLVLGLGIVLVGLVIPVIDMSHYAFLLVAILLIGSGMAILQVAGNPMMRDVSAEGKYARNLSFAQFIKAIGSNTGPYITPLIISLGFVWHSIFPVYFVVVLLTFIGIIMLKTTEQLSEAESTASIASCLKLLGDPYVLIMTLGIFFYVGAEVGISSRVAGFLEKVHEYDINSMATLGIGFFFLALMVGRLLGSAILNWLEAKKFFVITSLLSIAGLAGIILGSKTIVLASIFVTGFGFANIFPLIFSILIEYKPERSNELSGLLVMAIVGGAIMPLIMGFIADSFSIKAAFLVPLLSMLFITVTAFYSKKKRT